jgi:hypothetical protein
MSRIISEKSIRRCTGSWELPSVGNFSKMMDAKEWVGSDGKEYREKRSNVKGWP